MHLHVTYIIESSLSSPWASRCLIGLNLKGLQDVIGVSVVHPIFHKTKPDDETDKHEGWTFKRSQLSLQLSIYFEHLL